MKKSPIKQVIKVILILLAIITPIALAYYLPRLGPKPPEYEQTEQFPDVKPAELLAQSEALEKDFRRVISLREPTEEELEELGQALRKLEAYLTWESLPNRELVDRRGELRELFHEYSSRPLLEQSEELEETGREKERADDLEGAVAAFEKALELQETVNQDFPESSLADARRFSSLRRKLRYLKAEPIYRESRSLAKQAEEAAEANEWQEARELVAEAIRLQNRLNREFRGAPQASRLVAAELEGLATDYEAGYVHEQVRLLTERARNLDEEAEFSDAAEVYLEAMRRQRLLNQQFPDSGFASSDRVAELDALRQTALGRRLEMQIREGHRRLADLLKRRLTLRAIEVIEVLDTELDQFREAFPQSRADLEDIRLQVQYLSILGERMASVQDQVIDGLIPLPSDDKWLMFRTEVTQNLYQQVMGRNANPSEVPGSLRPVHSLSFAQAEQFCQRLGWVLGAEVRLPKVAELQKALGDLKYIKLETIAWGAANSGKEPQPVGTKGELATGFVDVIGNVAEWAIGDEAMDADQAILAGGSARDTFETLYRFPVRMVDRGEAPTFAGLRFVTARRNPTGSETETDQVARNEKATP